MEKQERILDLSIKLEGIIPIIDLFVQDIDNEDIELMEEVEKQLISKIGYSESAMVLLTAMGSNYNKEEDEMKLKTISYLIKIIEARKNGINKIKENHNKEIKKREMLEMIGFM